jgi:hypothetical protein
MSQGRAGKQHSKGQGEGQGQGQGQKEIQERATAPAAARAPDPDPPPEAAGQAPTAAGAVCKAMRQAGLPQANPGDPRLLELLRQGATQAEFVGLAQEAVAKAKGWAWVLVTLQARRTEAAAIALPAAPPTAPSTAAADTDRYLAEQAAQVRQRTAPPAELLARVGKAVKVSP